MVNFILCIFTTIFDKCTLKKEGRWARGEIGKNPLEWRGENMDNGIKKDRVASSQLHGQGLRRKPASEKSLGDQRIL